MTPDTAYFDPYSGSIKFTPIIPEINSPAYMLRHANRKLYNEFQHMVIPSMLSEVHRAAYSDAFLNHIPMLIRTISYHINLMELSSWKPTRDVGADPVNLPPHYDAPIEPTIFNQMNHVDWLLGNAHKYLHRYPFKNGIEDLKKAKRNLEMWYAWYNGTPDWSLSAKKMDQSGGPAL
jgi:hypothetical protein